MRLCVIGDELVAGTGDSRSLGWIGRVCARSRFKVPATVMALAMPGETTKEMGMRWEAEVSPRLADDQPRGLVIGVGPADVPAGVSTARSRLNLANITDRAAVLGIPCFVVGPPPLAGVDQQALRALSRSCVEVCRPRPVTPFTRPTARSASGDRALMRVDLPTPEWPTSTENSPLSASPSRSAPLAPPPPVTTTSKSKSA